MYFWALSRLRQRGCKSKLKYLLNMSCFWPKLCALSVKDQFNPRKWKKLLEWKIFFPKKFILKYFQKLMQFQFLFDQVMFMKFSLILNLWSVNLIMRMLNFFLMGDFNCNFASSQPNNNTKLLSNLSYVYGLHQLINTPTRVKSASSILMVVSFTNY